MKSIKLTFLSALLVCVGSLSTSSASAAETLKETLREAGWDTIIGTWVDADTNGSNVKMTYAWKFEDQLIELTSKMRERQSVALMGVNGKTGEVFHMGADSGGTSSLGKWEIDDSGDALLKVVYTTAEGQQGDLSIRFHKEGEDEVTMSIESPQQFSLKLIREK